MEKRRRARINNCLNELKTLILDAMKKDVSVSSFLASARRSLHSLHCEQLRARSQVFLRLTWDCLLLQPARHSKLEKADILEMTVKHLENMQRQQVALATATDPTVINKYRAGFSECAGEVGRFPGLEPAVRRRLLQHLAACLGSTTAGAEPGVPQSPPTPPTTASPPAQPQPLQLHILPEQNNGAAQTTGLTGAVTTNNGFFFSTGANGAGLQLVPTRLPNGDIALVLPSSRAGQLGQAGEQQQQLQQQLKASPPPSPSPSLSGGSDPAASPLPMLIPIPQRTASTASATSSASGSSFVSTSTSPVAFERLSVHSPAQSQPQNLSTSPVHRDAGSSPASTCYPPSPVSNTSMCSYDMKAYIQPCYTQEEQKPLALVTNRKKYEMEVDEEQPWRPW